MIRDDYKNNIINEYFDWILNMVCKNRYDRDISYRKLLSYLHNTEFRWTIPEDENRASDGINLRWRFACDSGREDIFDEIDECLKGPCSILEMMVALAIRCEETIMDDPKIGNRTSQWFWGMVTNLGLGSMTDDQFDKRYIDSVITKFLNRDYEPNGKGGLFTVRGCYQDLRDFGIWYQLCWYLDNIV